MKRLNAVIFSVLLLAFMGIVALFPRDERVIENENRSFNNLPELTAENIFGGGFGKQFEAWISDCVGYRADFITASLSIVHATGIKPPAPKPAHSEIQSPAQVSYPTRLTPNPISKPVPATLPVIQPEGAGTIYGNLLTFDDRLVEMFMSKPETAEGYAETINAYRAALGEDVSVFSMLIPTQIEFLPERYRSLCDSQRATIDFVYASLFEGITPVDSYSAIARHADEYIYFRTDHHWTALGAYYAYAEFARAAGFEQISLDEYEEIETPDFLGYLYNLSPSDSMRENPDIIYAYKYKGELATSEPLLLMPDEEEKATYGLFLGGDRDIITITTSVKNGKTAFIIKDSYANCFVPWLAPHYEYIVVFDPRKYEGSLTEMAWQYGKVDVIFLNYVFTTRFEDFIDYLQGMM